MNESWINRVLKDSQYNLLIFKDKEIKDLEKGIIIKNDKPYKESWVKPSYFNCKEAFGY